MKKMYYFILILGVCFLCYQAMSLSKHGLKVPNAANKQPAQAQQSGGMQNNTLTDAQTSHVSEQPTGNVSHTSQDEGATEDKATTSLNAPITSRTSAVAPAKTQEVDIYLHKANVESVDKLVAHSKKLSTRVSEAQASFPETVSEVSAANHELLADLKSLKREFDGITVQPCAQPTYKRMSQGLARFMSLLRNVSTSPYIKQNALQNKHFVQAIDYDAARKACDAF